MTSMPGRPLALRSLASAQVRERAAASVARRLLDGAGQAAIVAFREDPDTSRRPLAHGLTTSGDLALVLAPADAVAGEVRVRIDQRGAHHELSIATASLHALGVARIADPGELAALHDGAGLPTALAEVLDLSGGVLALVTTERVIWHGLGAVTPFDLIGLLDAPTFPQADDEWEAVEAVAAAVGGHADTLVARVATGGEEGVVGDAVTTPAHARHLGGRVLLADVDATGCTWVQVGADVCRSVFVPFATPVRSVSALAREVQRQVSVRSR